MALEMPSDLYTHVHTRTHTHKNMHIHAYAHMLQNGVEVVTVAGVLLSRGLVGTSCCNTAIVLSIT